MPQGSVTLEGILEFPSAGLWDITLVVYIDNNKRIVHTKKYNLP